MGAWGSGIWDNDGALDFLLELEKLSPAKRWQTIERDIRAGDRTHPAEAVPACEMLAFLLGQGRLDSRKSELRFSRPNAIADRPTPALVGKAVRYLERLARRRIGFFRPSDERAWKASLLDLAHRLRTATIQTTKYPGWSMTPPNQAPARRTAKRRSTARSRTPRARAPRARR